MSKVSQITKKAKWIFPVAAAVALSACSSGWQGEKEDKYVPASYSERYPIEVVKGTVKVNVPTRSGRMTAKQIDAVTRYAQQARSSRAQKIYVARPGASINGDAVAGRITQIFAEQGISSHLLVHSTYGSGRGPVSLSFVRKFAKTKKCGNWTEDFALTTANRAHPDFGCSYQHNLAAQIANPQDLITPRTSTPADAMRRHRVFADYRTPKSTTTPEDSNSKVSTTDAGKTE